MKSIVLEFEKVTKYPLIKFLSEYREFMLNSYPSIERYFSGKTTKIHNEHLTTLRKLTNDCKDVLAQFKNFSNKFSRCGYWELMELIEDLNTTIEKINKLPKFKRTVLSKRGYTPSVVVNGNVGGFRTMEEVAGEVRKLNEDNSDWINLMLHNDMNEKDWDIDQLTPINMFINNRRGVIVTTILDMPIGERIYGVDINKKITFKDNDLQLVKYKDNVEQKCTILLELNKGDVPENTLFGKNTSFMGSSVKGFAYPELVSDISNNFAQNDLFDYAYVKDVKFSEGSLVFTVEIKTKYDYKSDKKVTI